MSEVSGDVVEGAPPGVVEAKAKPRPRKAANLLPAEISGRVSKIAYAAQKDGEPQFTFTLSGKKSKRENFFVESIQRLNVQVVTGMLLAAHASDSKIRLKLQYGDGGVRHIVGIEVKSQR